MPLENKNYTNNLRETIQQLTLKRLKSDVDRLFKEHEELVKLPKLSEKEVSDTLSDLDKKQSEDVLKIVLDKIRKETTVLKYFDELEIPIYPEPRGENISGVKITMGGRTRNPRSRGGYDSLRDKVTIVEKWPSPKDILRNIQQDGSLGQVLPVVLHELTHSKQRQSGFLGRVLQIARAFYKYNTEFSESQAYRVEGRDYIKSTIWLFEQINKYYPRAGWKIDSDKLLAAILSVDRLNALGSNIAKIGQIIDAPGSWDEKSKTYPKIEQEIMRQAQVMFNSGDEEFLKDCLNELVISYKINQENQREKASIIAQEIIEGTSVKSKSLIS